MKYLKKYKVFESISTSSVSGSMSVEIENILKEVEECFYNISDNYNVHIIKCEEEESDILAMIESPVNRNVISPAQNNQNLKLYNIKDDLIFAINYLKSKFNLDLNLLQVSFYNDSSDYTVKSFDSFEDFNNFSIDEIDQFEILDLYFKYKNVNI